MAAVPHPATPAHTTSVTTVPPDGRLYRLGCPEGLVHICAAHDTTYNLTIVEQGSWTGQRLRANHPKTHQGDGSPTFICNLGPATLQILTTRILETG